MSAYGDVECDLCGVSYHELDDHDCDWQDIADRAALYKQKIAELEHQIKVGCNVEMDMAAEILTFTQRIAELEAAVNAYFEWAKADTNANWKQKRAMDQAMWKVRPAKEDSRE